MKSFVTKQELPIVTHVEPESLSDFAAIDDVVVLAYLRPNQDMLLKAFKSVAARYYTQFVFGYMTSTSTADAQGISMPSLVCYKTVDGDNRVFNGHFTEADIEKFLILATPTLIGEFTEKNANTYMTVSMLLNPSPL